MQLTVEHDVIWTVTDRISVPKTLSWNQCYLTEKCWSASAEYTLHLWAYVPPPVAMFFTLLQFAKHSGNFLLPPCLKFASEYAPLGRPFRRLDDHYFSIPKRNRTFNPTQEQANWRGWTKWGDQGGYIGIGSLCGYSRGENWERCFCLSWGIELSLMAHLSAEFDLLSLFSPVLPWSLLHWWELRADSVPWSLLHWCFNIITMLIC